MPILHLATVTFLAAIAVMNSSNASPLDEFHWKSRVLVVSAPAGDGAAVAQRRIYQAAAKGMSERQIVLAEALDDSDRSRQIRSRVSADGKQFQVFLVGKDGHTALSSSRPLAADDLFARVDAMPMRQDEMRRAR
jgi:hypothetical protein